MGGFDRRLIGVFAVLLVMAFWAGGKYEEIRSLRQAEEVIISTNMDEKPGHDNEQQQEPEMVYIKVYVTGEVNRPGVFEVPEGTRVYEAVELAGGVTEKSDVLHVDMARKLSDEETVLIPAQGENPVVQGGFSSPSSALVNINNASAQELDERLPGIGPAIAQRIVDYRTTYGPFKNIEDIKKVSGIGDKKFEELKGLIRVK
ncbi:MAG: helix-hairpin-helix domain-containing protein [Syntrophomonadaceae bacterium]|jgi:competence protein ComEA